MIGQARTRRHPLTVSDCPSLRGPVKSGRRKRVGVTSPDATVYRFVRAEGTGHEIKIENPTAERKGCPLVRQQREHKDLKAGWPRAARLRSETQTRE
jgi:hypothetical protein